MLFAYNSVDKDFNGGEDVLKVVIFHVYAFDAPGCPSFFPMSGAATFLCTYLYVVC